MEIDPFILDFYFIYNLNMRRIFIYLPLHSYYKTTFVNINFKGIGFFVEFFIGQTSSEKEIYSIIIIIIIIVPTTLDTNDNNLYLLSGLGFEF